MTLTLSSRHDGRLCVLECDRPHCQVVDPSPLPEPGFVLQPGLLLLWAFWRRRSVLSAERSRTPRSFAAILLFLAVLQVIPGSAEAVQIGLVPTASTVELGETFGVNVVVSELGAEIVSAYDLDLMYDESILTFVSLSFGTLLDPSLSDSLLSSGVVDFAQVSLASDATLLAAQPGSFTLAMITFDATGLGSSSLSLLLDDVNDVKGLLP